MNKGKKRTYDTGIGKLFASPSGYVLEFFVRNTIHDYSLREIQRETNVSFRTIQRIIPRFIKGGIIRHTRVVGTKCKMYQLIPSPRMDGLTAFHKSMTLPQESKSE